MSTALSQYLVHKFGGTSLQTPERIETARDLVLAESDDSRPVVIVSALGGVTDELLRVIDASLEADITARDIVTALKARHIDAAEKLVSGLRLSDLVAELKQIWYELDDRLDAVLQSSHCSPEARASILTGGERLSAAIMASAFCAADHEAFVLDARTCIRTDDQFEEGHVDFDLSNELIREAVAATSQQIIIVPGFTGATGDGWTTMLGRSGSDYSATIIAGALGAEKVIIWTDVPGVMSADPRLVPTAFTLPALS